MSNYYPPKTGLLAWDDAVAEARREYDRLEYQLGLINGGFIDGDAAQVRKQMNRAAFKIRQVTRSGWDFIRDDNMVTRISSRDVRSCVRSDGTISIEGYASVTGRDYQVTENGKTYTERIKQGAFAEALSTNPSLVLRLGGHDGAVIAEDLELFEDEIGLGFRATIAATSANLAVIRHANKASFTFFPVAEKFDKASNIRTISKVALLDGEDICLTEFPANGWTSVGFTIEQADQARLNHLFAECAKWGI